MGEALITLWGRPDGRENQVTGPLKLLLADRDPLRLIRLAARSIRIGWRSVAYS